jgi:hypothetical protein
MTLLNLFHAFSNDGLSVTIPVSLALLGIAGFLAVQAIKNAESVGGVWYKQNKAKMAAIAVVVWIASLFWIGSEYAPYNPEKHGVPMEQTDTTRQAAEDMIPK